MHAVELFPVERHLAAAHVDQAHDGLHHRGLARAVCADDGDDLAGVDIDVDVIEHLHLAIVGADVFQA